MGSKNDFEVMLDKIINITEKNISMQSTFLQEVHNLKSRFDTVDREQNDVKEFTKNIAENSFKMLSLMERTSNDEVIEAIEEIMIIIKGLDIKEIRSNVKKISDSWDMIKKILGAIAAILIVFQVCFSLYQSSKNNDIKKELSEQIETLLKIKK